MLRWSLDVIEDDCSEIKGEDDMDCLVRGRHEAKTRELLGIRASLFLFFSELGHVVKNVRVVQPVLNKQYFIILLLLLLFFNYQKLVFEKHLYAKLKSCVTTKFQKYAGTKTGKNGGILENFI